MGTGNQELVKRRGDRGGNRKETGGDSEALKAVRRELGGKALHNDVTAVGVENHLIGTRGPSK